MGDHEQWPSLDVFNWMLLCWH